jgi:hypothetical protein
VHILFFVVDFDELKQDISSFRYEMLNHVSKKDSHAECINDRMRYMEIKLNKLIDQQSILVASLMKKGSSDISHLLTQQSAVSTHDSGFVASVEGSCDSCQHKQSGQTVISTVLHDIQEERCGDIGSTSPCEEENVNFSSPRSPSQKRRDYHDIAQTSSVEMTVLDSVDLDEIVVAHDSISLSLSDRTNDHRL